MVDYDGAATLRPAMSELLAHSSVVRLRCDEPEL